MWQNAQNKLQAAETKALAFTLAASTHCSGKP